MRLRTKLMVPLMVPDPDDVQRVSRARNGDRYEKRK